MTLSADDPMLALALADARSRVKRFSVVRRLSSVDWGTAVGQISILSALNGPSTLGKLQKAFTELDEHPVEGSLSAGFRFGSEGRGERAQALEQWLGQYVAVRRRFVLALKNTLGADAAADAEEDFAQAYGRDRDYRLIWELRNLSEHGQVVANLFIWAKGKGEGGEVYEAHTLPLGPVLQAMEKERARQQLSALWDGVESVPVIGYFENCMVVLERIVCKILLRHEPELTTAAKGVRSLAAEASAGGKGQPVLMELKRDGAETRDWKMALLNTDLAEDMLSLLDHAHSVGQREARSGGSWSSAVGSES